MTQISGPFAPAILAVLGEPDRNARPVDATMLTRWSRRLPAPLLEIWSRYGMATLAGGRLHLTDPARLAGLVAMVVEGDPDLDGDTHAIAYGDLGELVLWSERHGYGFLSPVLLTLAVPNLTAPARTEPDTQFVTHVLQMPPELIEAFDPAQQPVHDAVAARLGPLAPGRIYATPIAPPPLGGTPVPAFEVAAIEEWFEACYGAASVSLVDWDRDPPTQRMIGPQPVGGRP